MKLLNASHGLNLLWRISYQEMSLTTVTASAPSQLERLPSALSHHFVSNIRVVPHTEQRGNYMSGRSICKRTHVDLLWFAWLKAVPLNGKQSLLINALRDKKRKINRQLLTKATRYNDISWSAAHTTTRNQLYKCHILFGYWSFHTTMLYP